MEVVTIVGNGTSIVFSDALRGDNLARAVAEQLTPPLDKLFATTAKRVRNDSSASSPGENFEDLLGPFDRMGVAMGPLADIADALGDAGGVKAVRDAERFVRQCYLRGLGIALRVVAHASRAQHGPDLDRYEKFVRWVFDREPTGPAVFRFFNLNYDGLLDSRVLALREQVGVSVADQATGQDSTPLEPAGAQRGSVRCFPLRDPLEDEYIVSGRMALLYHLHGSLAWVRDPDGAVFKVERLQWIRDTKFFDKVAERKTPFEPVVVLTDRKSSETLREPFFTAYQRLSTSIADADLLIIAGYGFGDAPLNKTVARALSARAGALPRILVFGYTSAGSSGLRQRVLKKLAPNPDVRAKVDKVLTLRAAGLPDDLKTVPDWGR